MSFKVVIPARYASTRLPGKPLLEIQGKPMVQWVVDAACASAADEVLVATDDARIAAVVNSPRGATSLAVMTRSEHRSGTDRIAEVADQLQWDDDDIVVNVQGDEPLLDPTLIEAVAGALRDHGLRFDARILPDHARLTVDDIEFGDALPVLMTEKDAVKCTTFATSHHWAVGAEVLLDSADQAQLVTEIQHCLAAYVSTAA